MLWIMLGIVFWGIMLFLIPIKQWKSFWLIGIISMIILYFIDSTLIALKAFKFIYNSSTISGLPFPYWLGSFPIGILLVKFCPIRQWARLLYIALSAFVLLALELVIVYLGYFSYINWNPLKSFLLNIGGFTILLWFAESIFFIEAKKLNPSN